MFLSALRSIKDDFSRSLFYWLTFVLTSMFIFLFFNISYSDNVGVTFINNKNDIATYITVFVIGICMVVIFFANDFFVKKKAKNLAIQLVCGGTYFQIAKFILYQTGILLILAIPVGISIALSLIPIINLILSYYYHSASMITIDTSAIISTILILGIVIFYSTILNLGYAYRNSIHSLINEEKISLSTNGIPFSLNLKLSKRLKKIISCLLYFLPLVFFYIYGHDQKTMLFFSIVGMFGFYMFLNNIFIPHLNKLLQETKTDNPILLIYLGFMRTDIIVLKSNIILLIISAILFVSLFVVSLNNPMEMILSYISFTVINLLLLLSIMFKYSTEIASRKHIYQTIERIGYTKEEQSQILKKEVFLFYLLISLFSLIYIINIILALIFNHILTIDALILLLTSFTIPFIICSMINYFYYKRTILKG